MQLKKRRPYQVRTPAIQQPDRMPNQTSPTKPKHRMLVHCAMIAREMSIPGQADEQFEQKALRQTRHIANGEVRHPMSDIEQ